MFFLPAKGADLQLDTKETKNQGRKIICRNSAARFTEIFKLAALRQ
jgi:hypothetical protein